jgi:hypothetical protein
MTRTSKQEERRAVSPKKRKKRVVKKTGPKKDNLKLGYKEHANATSTEFAFIPKIR